MAAMIAAMLHLKRLGVARCIGYGMRRPGVMVDWNHSIGGTGGCRAGVSQVLFVAESLDTKQP
jgi:hypothetical protein